MKRIHVINLEKTGGAEKIFIQYLQHNKEGEDSIFCISRNIDPMLMKSLKKYKICLINNIFSNKNIRYPAFLRKRVLQRRLEKSDADAAIFWDIVPGLINKPKNIKTIYYDHGSAWRFDDNLKTRTFFSYIDAAIAASQASKAMMTGRFKLNKAVEIVNNVLPVPVINEKKERPGKEDIKLGVACRLVPLKGIGTSIMTVAELIHRGYQAKLYISGKGPNEKALIELAKKLGVYDN
ncbi:hypothetical protein ACGVWS_14825, partial [Enterobacteriaceae bacterium LUAb1]